MYSFLTQKVYLDLKNICVNTPIQIWLWYSLLEKKYKIFCFRYQLHYTQY